VIELVSPSRCIDCNKCVEVCPTNVFDEVPGGHPVIARQQDCQTCFMCEAHCPDDALYVSPLRAPAPAGSSHLDEARLLREGYFGSYRARLGWGGERHPPRDLDELMELSLIGPRVMAGRSSGAGEGR
jgi:NAD-dependent dihydropyrimidine dehydrogenase PreA subunit